MLRTNLARRARRALLPLAGCLLAVIPSAAAPADPLTERIAAVSAAYLGTSYARDPLGEGKGPDPDPLVDRRRVDCVTFVEQVLAEALAPTPSEMLPTLTRIRYREGQIDLACRNHFFVADWIPQNRRLVSDVTSIVGGAAVRRMTKTIDRAALLRSRGCPPNQCRVAAERLTLAYIPRVVVADLLHQRGPARRFPAAAIAVFVSGRPDLDAVHTGFLLAREGELYLRHASQRRGRVVEERLLDYLDQAPTRVVGLTVYAIHSPGRSSRSSRSGANRGRASGTLGSRSPRGSAPAGPSSVARATSFRLFASNE